MDEAPDQKRFLLNGIDISHFVRDAKVSETPEPIEPANLRGLKATGPITIEVDFDDRPKCGVCSERFEPGPEGLPILTNTTTGDRFTVCPGCFVAIDGTGVLQPARD